MNNGLKWNSENMMSSIMSSKKNYSITRFYKHFQTGKAFLIRKVSKTFPN